MKKDKLIKLENLKRLLAKKDNGLYKIYTIEFNDGGYIYIGRTKTSERQRVSSHLFDRELKNDTSVHWEFTKQGIHNMKDFDEKCTIEYLIDPDQSINSETEKKVIQRYERLCPDKLLNVALRKNRP